MDFSQSLSEWAKDKPLSILQLDPADRAVLKIADERDAIQKKTFTKWLNKHLKKHWRYLEVNRNVDDLFEDLRDGHNLVSLLEVLSGELLSRERGRMRFHQLQNVQTALDFLKNRNIRLVNIRPEDIVDGNPKLTLGLIWTIILHFQISDIITGLDDSLTAREALLKWAQRTTERYPGVRVTDFSKSWKDGLAFNAILHRNRPDLLDFRSLKIRNPRDNLELAFSLAEKEFGITRLLDPEDVDTPEPDEKSLITYISSLYDVFPEPPSHHPFADDERNRKVEEYKDLAMSLQKWMYESLETFRNQVISNSVIDMKNLLLESSKFRSDELPKRQRDKQRISLLHREIQKLGHHSSQIEFRKDLNIDEIDKNWNKVMTSLQDRDKKIKDEICRLEKLQRLAEKIGKDFKVCEGKLEDVEKRMKEEEKRISKLLFLDAKQNCDQIENDFKYIDSILKSLQKEVASLEEKKYYQISDLQNRLKVYMEKYQCLRTIFQTNLILLLSEKSDKSDEKKVIKQRKQNVNEKPSEDNKAAISFKEYFEWIEKKQKRILAIELGGDVHSIKSNLEQLQTEQKTVEQYNKKISAILSQTISKDSDNSYATQAEKLQGAYKQLITLTSSRVKESESLLDFVQLATKALKWMSDKEDTEISRDWSAKNLNILDLEHHQEILTSELEKKEIEFNSIQSRGENLLFQKHSGSKCIEDYLSQMQNQWSWILQLTLCLEIHLRYAQFYHQFFKETKESESWVKKAEDKLNTTFSKSVTSVDEGERCLKQMEVMKDDITQYNDRICDLVSRSQEVIPLKQRKSIQSSKPVTVLSLCNYKNSDVIINKDEMYKLKEISKKHWKISTSSGKEVFVPGVCFVIPPPDPEAVEMAQSLKKRYEELLKLWKLKQKKLRQSLIFATIKAVKSWDITQIRTMDISQRESIMSALNSDAQKLLLEGSETDSTLLKLKQEMEQCNSSYETLLKKVSEETSDKSPKSVGRKLTDTIAGLQNVLNEKEKFLKNKLQSSIICDLDALENSVIEHKDYEISLRNLEDQINETVQMYKSTNKKTTAVQLKYDTLIDTWSKLWDLSNLYIEKLKVTEVTLNKLNEALTSVSSIEVKLASCNNMSSKLDKLQRSHDDLLLFQDEMQLSQSVIDELQDSSRKLKAVVQKIKTKQGTNVDCNRIETDIKKILTRWDNARSQIVERLRSCGASSELLQTYKNKIEQENVWISETTVKMNSLKTVQKLTTKEIELTVEPAMDLYSNISERSSSIEETNTLGSRYIREAKIYDLRLKHYKENLEEEHPSLDASFPKTEREIIGACEVEQELENLNEKYSCLMRTILQYIEELKEMFTAQQKIKAAVQGNYQVCEENAVKLESWMKDIELKLAELGVIQETIPGLQHQIATVKVLKEQLESQQMLVNTCLDQMRQLAQRGLEILTKEEINNLQKNLISLKRHYDSLLNDSDRLLRRLVAAYDELLKFKTEMKSLVEWLNQSRRQFNVIESSMGALSQLEKKSELVRSFSSDVIAHQADLRFITMAAQKFANESQDYLKALNTLRSNLPQKLPSIPAGESEVKSEVQEITSVFHTFLNEVNKLTDNYTLVLNKYRLYSETVEKAKSWITEVRKSAKSAISEPLADEPSALQNQLDKIKVINMEVVGQSRLIENVYQSVKNLTDTLENCNIAPTETKSIESSISSLQENYSELCDQIANRIKELQTALIHSQDFQAGLERISKWLMEVESSVKAHNKPISLLVEKLEQQVQECKILKSDISNQKQSIDMLMARANESIDANPNVAKKVTNKLNDVSQRFQKLFETVSKRFTLLEEVSENVHAFEEMVIQFEEWLTSTTERVETTDNIHLADVDGFSSVIEYSLNQKNSKKEEFDRMMKIGKNLISRKDTSDADFVKNKMSSLEKQWKNLSDLLNEKKKLGQDRAEQLNSYDNLHAKVLDWLMKKEKDYEKLEPLVLEETALKKQATEVSNLIKEHTEYSTVMEQLNNLGSSCDAPLRGDSMKSKASSPVKKLSSPIKKSPSKSKSTDNITSYTVRGHISALSPVSTISSGFSSNRSSTDNIGGIDDFSAIQQQVSEVNDRYNILGSELSERNQEISETLKEVKSYLSIVKTLSTFVEEKTKKLPKEGLPSKKGAIESQLKFIKGLKQEIQDKQSEMDTLKSNVSNLVTRKKIVKGGTELEEEVLTLERNWLSLSKNIEKRLFFLQNLIDYQDSLLSIQNWLNQKEKMLQVLGPIASEPRMVTSQVQQVQVMREEFTSQEASINRLKTLSITIIEYLQSIGSNTEKVEEEINLIQSLYCDMSNNLIEREKNLDAAMGVSKGFYKNLAELQSKLQQLSDKFEKFEEENYSSDVLLKKITELEDELEKLRPSLTDASSSSVQLCEILSDSSSKNEIKYKINVLEKSYANIQKKIELKKAELESILNEDKLFYKVCKDIQQWLSDMDSKLSRSLPISTSIEKLSKNLKEYEAYYKEVINKEHEVYLCLSKGSDMLTKLSGKQEPSSVKKKLDSIKTQFEKVKKTATDKNTVLRSCLEKCKNLNAATETFEPWLTSMQEKITVFNEPTLKRDALNKKLKEIQILRGEMSVHSQEFQNIQSLGEAILTSCDSDKDLLKKRLDEMSKKWKKLTDEISTRNQLLDDLSQLLFEFDEKFRDVEHTVQRIEDRICSHDTLEISGDRIMLERLQALLNETKTVKEEIRNVRKFSKVLIDKAGPNADASEIVKNLDSIEKRHQSLQKKLEEKCSSMSTSYKVVSVFMESIKSLQTEINSLEETFDDMHSISRDYQVLKTQLKELKTFKSSISKTKESYTSAKKVYDDMVKKNICDTKTYLEQMNNFNKKIGRIEERVKEREISIETSITRLESFQSVYKETLDKISSLINEEKKIEITLGDVDSIRSQQKTFKKMCETSVKPLSKTVMEVNKLGQGLIQSASNDVDTSSIEQNLDVINNSWNDLQESINEKEKKLDIALLQSGKFQEALSGVEKWLNDTEDMVSKQKAPSFDFKVVKAQVQEQKFLKKMLLDRQNSVISLKSLGSEFVSTSKSAENELAETLMKTLSSRFEELISTAEERMVCLESTMPLAQDFQTSSATLSEWLETTEKKLASMTSIPVEEPRIKVMISNYKVISNDIEQQKKSLEKVNTISQRLKKVVNPTETESLVQKVDSINEKFKEIEVVNKNVGSLLERTQKGIHSFSITYSQVITRIEEISTKLKSFQRLSTESTKLQTQLTNLRNLKEKLDEEKTNINKLVTSGEEIMKYTSGEDAIQMKEKLDTLSMKLSEVSNKLSERLKTAEESFPLVESFYTSINKLTTWLDSIERSLKQIDNSSLDVQSETIKKLEDSIPEYRTELDKINNTGPRLSQLAPGESSMMFENQITRVNHRFEKVCEQVQRKAERIQLTLQRKFDVVGDIDELCEWFKEVENKVTASEGLSSEPSCLSTLLKKQKTLCDDLNGQKNRVRDVTTTAKKLLRESSSDDLSYINEKIETLKTKSNNVVLLCQERLSTLEQAFPLAQHFYETHTDLGQWLDEVEGEAELLEAPALNSVQIKKQHERNKNLSQSVQEHKPLVDKLNKTGTALTKLCTEEESDKLEVILESDNSRYNALRKILREHQVALEEALQATSQFSDKLEGILTALTSTADQLNNAEPISAHPDRIQEQINDNRAVLQDLDKRTITLEAVKKAADDVIGKASKIDEPAVNDIKMKLDRLNDLWATIQTAAHKRGKSLEEALIAAEKFWDELTAVMKALKELQGNLNAQEPPAVEPAAVHQQHEVLQEIKQEITQTKPEVDHCRQAGQNLMQLCGEPDKPEVKKHIEDLDSAWENVTTLYAKREENLIAAMEKAMTFHDTLHNLLEFLDTYEDRFSKFGAVSSDIDSVKNQIKQLKDFKNEVDPHMIEVEALNRSAQELMERTSSDQAVTIREPLRDINKRWDDLLKNIVDRQQEMEKVLLRLGQFQHALEEHIIWITKTEKTLDELKPVLGDPQVIEVVLAKHKVIANDIQAHQSSIDAILQAGREFVDTDRSSEDAKYTHNKLQDLKTRWQNLQDKSTDRYRELEEALKEAQKFHQDIQDMLMWLNETDGHLVTSKPVGGLPETAKEQLNRFMDLYNELETNRYKIESLLEQGENYTKKSGENCTKNLQHSLKTLKQRWDSILNKANDRKIKLEIALREATEFHEALQAFVEWLTSSEKYLCSLKPVSRHMKSVLEQIEEHRNFQKDLSSHREVMLNLDKKGTHLKYFSQKQDVILIKNLLISVQHRWEKVVSKAAERTRALDHGYKESKEFHDSYTALSAWLDETEKLLDSTTPIGNDPVKIKKLLAKHKDFQRTLGSKQVTYDATMKCGRMLKDKCPKQDVQLLQNMMDELKTRWNKICSKSVDRQRKLEEALLFSGQFKDAVLALMDWIDKTISALSVSKPYHGDLDTVTSLIEQHKSFEEEFKNKGLNLESVCKTAVTLKNQASSSDVETITAQVEELNKKWKIITDLNEKKKSQLKDALQLAEELYKLVHMLLEWLSDAEMKLRFFGSLPEDEESSKKQIQDHEIFMAELERQEVTKNKTIALAQDILKKCHPDGISVIRHWITIIQSRWDEISSWAKQRDQRLRDHLLSLRDISDLLEELFAWLNNAEATLTALEAEPLPDDLPTLDRLIEEHQLFMADMSKKQPDIEKISKTFSSKRHQSKNLGSPQIKEKVKEKLPRSGTPTGVKTSTPLRSQFDSDVKHPRAKQLLEKWRIVWLLAMERQRRLQDKYNYLMELDRIKHFDFDEWRTRYLGWLNNKKSRVMDQFKKIDKNNVGKVTKQDFIDGILKSKFATSRLEMERVADIFDRNGDGFIDSKEYVETLRPEKETGPLTEAEKIQDEVQRQVAKCTCVHRFKVYQVGEGKYRFGESQKLRLVRILRSTVMVRVGGGWVALDEFLVKNDPCRAKGRTNIELREQFILADGVSQSLAPFKPKPSPNSSISSQSGTNSSMPSTGPITKIREKSERSTPMRRNRSSAENSSDISGPSFSETDSFSNRSAYSRTTPSSRLSPRDISYKSTSRPSSRQGSRPSSRAPSDLSQDGIEEFKSKRKQTFSGNGVIKKNAAGNDLAPKTIEASRIPSVKKSIKLPKNFESSSKKDTTK